MMKDIFDWVGLVSFAALLFLLVSGCSFNAEVGTGWSWGKKKEEQPQIVVVPAQAVRVAPTVVY